MGESERAVREVFRKARAAAPCIIFFVRPLAPSPSTNATEGPRLLELTVGSLRIDPSRTRSTRWPCTEAEAMRDRREWPIGWFPSC